ncbi:DUF2927 domain-containing protein [Marinobacterium mangrovicola]|uniref:DUF2927 family protein n=1 Tax=Marinobacterium mangrovicola TaxID=1476959 RepID=A0A4R1GDQ4_9GAMM|nr:DUF2927 domain-containing protein [Marinobacterium mangrovicola]TCK04735.1 Protein of unknown function (DUF2927) [Marinobacterium mangrovicola]
MTRGSGWLLLLLFCPLLADAQPGWQRPGYIVDSLIEVALRSEYGRDPMRLRKWTEPVRVHVDHRVGDPALHNELVDAQLSQLADITGHSIRRVSGAGNVDLVLLRQSDLAVFWRQRAGEPVPGGALCLARIWVDEQSRIQRALIAIPVDRARERGRLVSCIVEELTQILGLPNDSEKVFPSIFNDKSTDQLLSGLDLVLLRLLYDPRLEPGMGPDAVRSHAKTVLAELTASGVVDKADTWVRKGAMYRLMGY